MLLQTLLGVFMYQFFQWTVALFESQIKVYFLEGKDDNTHTLQKG